MSTPTFPGGVWPVMLTPFHADRSIDWEGVDRLTDWYIEAGVAGLFAVAQSSEMFALDDDERLALARRVVRRANGRVPVVATGTFVRSIEEQAAFIARLYETGVRAITILSGMMATAEEDDAVWRGRVERLLALTDPIPLTLYECPAPYHRLIAPELVAWAGGTGRFHLLKETSRSPAAVQAKVDAASGTPLGVYNADATSLLSSLRGGARGYCGIAANFYPDLLAWLCSHATDTPAAEELQAFLSLADPTIHRDYPVSAKVYQQLAGVAMLPLSRVSTASLTEYDERVLHALTAQVRQRRAALNIATARVVAAR
jgi:4-hydroxy-tetrahydrodipicolinate synthase